MTYLYIVLGISTLIEIANTINILLTNFIKLAKQVIKKDMFAITIHGLCRAIRSIRNGSLSLNTSLATSLTINLPLTRNTKHKHRQNVTNSRSKTPPTFFYVNFPESWKMCSPPAGSQFERVRQQAYEPIITRSASP